jgi:hypothetical protein
VVPANWYDVDNPTYTSPELVDEASDLYAEYYPSAWTIGVGSGSVDGTQTSLDRLQIKPNGSFLPVGVYVLSFDVTSGSSTYGVYSNSAGGYITSALSVGSYSVVVNQSSLSELKFVVAGGDVVSIDNVSVRQVSAPQFGWPEPEYIGPNLVDNGGFDTNDLTGWSDTSTGTGTTVDASTGAAVLTGVDLSNRGQITSDTFATVVGKTYTLVLDVSNAGANYQIQVKSSSSNIVDEFGSLGNGQKTYTFVADRTTTWLLINVYGSGSVTFDNVSVREINPLSVSFQMDGRMTYADDGSGTQVFFSQWLNTSTSDYLVNRLDTTAGSDSGRFYAIQYDAPTTDLVGTAASYYTPGVLVPFNIASRHGSTFVNGAVDGVALDGKGREYGNTTPKALPDLSNTDLQIAYDFMGTIGQFRQFAEDVGDAGLVTATKPSTEPTLSLTFDGTGGSFYNLNWSE